MQILQNGHSTMVLLKFIERFDPTEKKRYPLHVYLSSAIYYQFTNQNWGTKVCDDENRPNKRIRVELPSASRAKINTVMNIRFLALHLYK